MDRNDFNEIVDGLIKRFELLSAYGVLEAPVLREKLTVLYGCGKQGARVAFVEAADFGTDGRGKKGEPFTEKERELVERVVGSMSLEMEDVYICAVARGRPGGSVPEFEREIKRVSPRIIVTFGEEAARMVLAKRAPFTALRGRFHSYGAIKVMPTHHPSTLIKNPGLKRQSWEDIKMVIGALADGT
jgi:DNA polymerase